MWTIGMLLFTVSASAQWSGPTSNLLSTSNNVLISQNGPLTPLPGGTIPPLFQVKLTAGSTVIYPLHVDNSGKIGLGVNNPLASLHIGNGGNFRMTRTNGNPFCTIDAIGKFVLTTDGYDNQYRGLFVSNGTYDFLKVTQSSMIFATSTKDILKVDGNVSVFSDLMVKDANNDVQFRVYNDGTVRAREVRVNLATIPPDYVFDKNYKLLSMKEVESYIAEHKHLPNVPSAKEMMTEGSIDMSAMQLKLLEKIEELTLYMIKLNAENEMLKARVCQLEGVR